MHDTLAGSSPAEELGKGGSGQAVSRDRDEEGQRRKACTHIDVGDLLRKTKMPARRRAAVLLRLIIYQQQRGLESLRQPDELELPTLPKAPQVAFAAR